MLFHVSRLYLRQLHVHLYPFSQLWVAQAQQGTRYELPWMNAQLCQACDGRISIPEDPLALAPTINVFGSSCGTCHLLCPQGKRRGSAVFTDSRFMGQPPAATYKNVIRYLCSWLLPKKNYMADLYQYRKKMYSVMPKQMCFLSCG